MPFQFMHIESYSRSTPKTGKTGGHSVRSIVAEANRESGSTHHIEAPLPPTYVYGRPLVELEATCESWAAGTTDAKGRKTRKDALCLLAGVFSTPEGTSPELWESIKADALEWLQDRYGDRLQTVVEHTDEAHPHCHFYVIPSPGERFDVIHDGKRAANELPKDALKGDRNQAYKRAMRSLQDDYHEHVGAPNGMTRIGPGRRRLTREAWKLEQSQTEDIGQKLRQAEALVVEAEHTIESAKTSLERIRSDALAEKQKALADAAETLGASRQQGIEQGRIEALNQFGKLSLWAKLAGLLSRKDTEITALEGQMKVLRKERDKAVKQAEKSTSLIATVKAAGRRISERFVALEQERDAALTLAEKAFRQRDQFHLEVQVLRERNESNTDLTADRDLQRARADLAERKLALYGTSTETSQYEWKTPVPIAMRLSLTGPEHIT